MYPYLDLLMWVLYGSNTRMHGIMKGRVVSKQEKIMIRVKKDTHVGIIPIDGPRLFAGLELLRDLEVVGEDFLFAGLEL